jgi:hypothetical protein
LKVTPSGDDALGSASGGTQPFGSVQGAIDFADQHRSHATSVCVANGADCSAAGSYATLSGSDLVMRDGISVYGSYEASTWTRCADSLQHTQISTSGANGVYFGPAIAARTVFDGFSVWAPGVRIEAASSVQLSNLTMVSTDVNQANDWPTNPTAVLATGNVDGLIIEDSEIHITGTGAVNAIELLSCAGSATISNNDVLATVVGTSGGAGALGVTGSCTPLITGNSLVSAGGDGVNNTSVGCAAPCTLRDNPELLVEKSGNLYSNALPTPFRGNVTVLYCEGCAEVTHNTVTSSVPVSPFFNTPNGYVVTAAYIHDTPLVARNDISSGCADHAVALDAANGRLENNVLVAGCFPPFGSLSYLQYSTGLIASGTLDVNSNLITSLAPYFPGQPSNSLGIQTFPPNSTPGPLTLRDNIVHGNQAALNMMGGSFLGVQVPTSEGLIIENNDLTEPAFTDTIGTTQPNILAAIASTGNFTDICASTSDYHLIKGSACIDRGTPSGAPKDDRDGELRDATPDVGPDEWSAAHDPCAAVTCSGHGTCGLSNDSPRCTCDSGYVPPWSDSTACIVDGCATCDPNANCAHNQNDTFTCGPCKSGFSGTPETGCLDIDECLSNNGGCDSHATCTNTPGSRLCGDCPSGYSGSGYGVCTAQACPAGYTGTIPSGCVDIDECAGGACDPLTTCTNLPGSYSCGPCPAGYSGSGSSGCTFDPCAGVTCENGGTCVGDASGAACICPPGITGKSCELEATKLSGVGGFAALYSDGSIATWAYGTTPLALPGTFTDVAAGYGYVCGIDTTGHVQCAGNYGFDPLPTEVFSSITANTDHRCGIHPDGTVGCWGYNNVGQASPPTGTFSRLAIGYEHSCGILTSGALECWGTPDASFAHGQEVPPPGSFRAIAANLFANCAIRNDGAIVCWGLDFTNGTPPPTGSFVALSLAANYGCAIRDDGTLACWGTLAFGREATPAGTYKAIGTGENSACAQRSDDVIACWGIDQADLDGLRNPPDGDFSELADPCALVNCGAGTCSTLDDLHCTCPDADVHRTDDVFTCVPSPCGNNPCAAPAQCVVTDSGSTCTSP